MSNTNQRKDSIGDRMKGYEHVERRYLTKRTPTLIRLDGKAFHSFTRGFQRPFDPVFIKAMQETAKYLCENIMGCKLAYWQSDEITLLLTDWDNLTTQSWFDKNLQKMCSISASMATMAFNKAFGDEVNGLRNSYYNPASSPTDEQEKQLGIYDSRINTAMFDSRVWTVPLSEVVNNFIWRQQDATRNAIQMLGQSEFSHKELHGKNCSQIQEMLFQERGINFNDLETYKKRGACVVKETYEQPIESSKVVGGFVERTRWVVDEDIPIFTQDRNYIGKFLDCEEKLNGTQNS
jgi:tRNA(His) 5'-end guanylyltransferase